MPKINGLGISEYTEKKQEIYNSITSTLIGKINGIINNEFQPDGWVAPEVLIIDTTSGPGKYMWKDKEIIGSPLSIISTIKKYPRLKANIHFIEEKWMWNRLLKMNINGYHNPNHKITIHPPEKFEEIIPIIMKKSLIQHRQFGWIYNDPSGEAPQFDRIAKAVNLWRYKYFDVIINVACTAIKRIRRCGSTKECRSLLQYLQLFQKNHWYVSEPYGKNQWTMILGSNYKFSKNEIKPLHFWQSDRGQEIFDKVEFSNDERKNWR